MISQADFNRQVKVLVVQLLQLVELMQMMSTKVLVSVETFLMEPAKLVIQFYHLHSASNKCSQSTLVCLVISQVDFNRQVLVLVVQLLLLVEPIQMMSTKVLVSLETFLVEPAKLVMQFCHYHSASSKCNQSTLVFLMILEAD